MKWLGPWANGTGLSRGGRLSTVELVRDPARPMGRKIVCGGLRLKGDGGDPFLRAATSALSSGERGFTVGGGWDCSSNKATYAKITYATGMPLSRCEGDCWNDVIAVRRANACAKRVLLEQASATSAMFPGCAACL